jgi:multimeric flavodoxin WrbA
MRASEPEVVVLLGSPRKKGNSTLLAREVMKGATDSGVSAEEFYLHGMKIAPCSACEGCKRGPEGEAGLCVVDDDMQRIYPAVIAAKTLVLASPVYCFTFSAQMKLFMDRCYALWSPGGHRLGGKNVVAILTYGAEDIFEAGGVNALRTYQDAYSFYGSHLRDVLHCQAGEAGEVSSNAEIMEKAYRLGSKIAAYG